MNMFIMNLDDSNSMQSLAKRMDDMELPAIKAVNADNEPICIERKSKTIQVSTYRGTKGVERKEYDVR